MNLNDFKQLFENVENNLIDIRLSEEESELYVAKLFTQVMYNEKMDLRFSLDEKVIERRNFLNTFSNIVSKYAIFYNDFTNFKLLLKNFKSDGDNERKNNIFWKQACYFDSPKLLEIILENNIEIPMKDLVIFSFLNNSEKVLEKISNSEILKNFIFNNTEKIWDSIESSASINILSANFTNKNKLLPILSLVDKYLNKDFIKERIVEIIRKLDEDSYRFDYEEFVHNTFYKDFSNYAYYIGKFTEIDLLDVNKPLEVIPEDSWRLSKNFLDVLKRNINISSINSFEEKLLSYVVKLPHDVKKTKIKV